MFTRRFFHCRHPFAFYGKRLTYFSAAFPQYSTFTAHAQYLITCPSDHFTLLTIDAHAPHTLTCLHVPVSSWLVWRWSRIRSTWWERAGNSSYPLTGTQDSFSEQLPQNVFFPVLVMRVGWEYAHGSFEASQKNIPHLFLFINIKWSFLMARIPILLFFLNVSHLR